MTAEKSITDLWYEQGYEEGFKVGYEEGYEEGFKEGYEEGLAEARMERILRSARLLQGMFFPQGDVISMLCQVFSLTEEQARSYLAQV